MNYSGIDLFRQWRNDKRRGKLTRLFHENLAIERGEEVSPGSVEIDGGKMQFAGICLALLQCMMADMFGTMAKKPAYTGVLALYGLRVSVEHAAFQGHEKLLMEGQFEAALLQHDVMTLFNERGEFVPKGERPLPEWLNGVTAQVLVKVTAATMLCVRVDGSES